MIRRSAALLLVVLALVTLHFVLHLTAGLGDAAPDLLTVGVLLLARQVHMGVASAVGFGLGLLEDSLSVVAFGSNALALTVVGAVGARTREWFMGDSLLFMASYLAAGKWLRDFLHWLLVGPGFRDDFLAMFFLQAPLAALYAAAFGLVALQVKGVWRE